MICRGDAFYKQLSIPSQLPTKRHHKTVGDGALDVPPTNDYKILMAKEETNALKRDVEPFASKYAVPYGFKVSFGLKQ